MPVRLTAKRVKQLQLNLEAEQPARRAERAQEGRRTSDPTRSNFDGRLSAAATKGWYRLDYAGGDQYRYTNVDGRQLQGTYDQVTRAAATGR